MGNCTNPKHKMKRVVIVGAGVAGIAVARSLDGKVDLTLIEKNGVTHHAIGSLRAVFDDDLRWKHFIPLPQFKSKSSKVIRGEVVDATATEVVLKSGDKVPYDILVIATGTNNNSPAKFDEIVSAPETSKIHEQAHEAVKAANNILIVGGGPVGVELAGEIHHNYPNKHITICHSGKTLLSNQGGGPQLTDLFFESLDRVLKAANVTVLLNTRVTNLTTNSFASGPQTVTTRDGKALEADLVFNCTGSKPSTRMFKSLLGSSIDSNGLIDVNSHLQVQKFPNVFALGDVTNLPEPKLAYIAESKHAPVAIKNILALAKNKAPSARHDPTSKMASIFLVFGPTVGVIQVGFAGCFNGVKTSGMLANLKNKMHLFVDKRWQAAGYKVPKTKSASPLFSSSKK
eukprot:c12689_g1_i1.p1 GENE.c12689_g1_i1~~c12689_g1_i1.p1  ORF type:complete len:400 (-),score=99.22 c12689_g1_i1:21-1220(-)